MYNDHPKFKKPDDKDAMIWRYMDFINFVSFLDKKSLYFSRADELQDPYEDKFAKAVFGRRIVEVKKGPKEPQKRAEQQAKAANDKKLTYVNCWHMNHIESASMWQVYLKSDEGVAIQSTYGKLKQSLSAYTKGDVYVGMVGYIDFAVDTVPDDYDEFTFMYKRSTFAYEHELRAVVQEDVASSSKSTHELGKYIHVNPDVLVDKIFVSPTSPIWFYELVNSVTGKFGLNKKVMQSRHTSGQTHAQTKDTGEWFNKQ